MKPKIKKNKSKTKSIAEQEASLFKNPRLSKEAFNRGFDLGTTGVIRSLLNFIGTSTFSPVTKKTKKTLSLSFNDTADKWIENLQEECNTPDNAEYYHGWTDEKGYKCERDTLNENHPDYQIFGGKIGVHSTINKKLNNIAKEINIEEAEFYNRDEEYYEKMADVLENINLTSDEYYNKDFLNRWKNELVKNIKNNEENNNYHIERLKEKLSKKEKENSLTSIKLNTDNIEKAKKTISNLYFLAKKPFYSYNKLKNIIDKNIFNLSKSELNKLSEINYLRKNINPENFESYIKFASYDPEIHKIIEESQVF